MARRGTSRLSWFIMLFAVLFILALAFAFWVFLPRLLSRAPATTPTVSLLDLPTRTPIPLDTPTLALTKTLSPDLIERTPTAVPTLAYLWPQTFPRDVDPLTGLKLLEPAILDRRPLAIKVSNFPRYVRNWQSGLTQADHVFEYHTEDLETRFIAVFYGTDASRVGAVRSARFFDEHIVRMYHAYLVYSGADARVDGYFASTDIADARIKPTEYNCPPLCQDGSISDYNNYFMDTSKVNDFLDYVNWDNTRQELTGMVFSSAPPFTTTFGSRVFVRFSSRSYNYWEYDRTTGRYLRWEDTVDLKEDVQPAYAPHIDNLNAQQNSTDNIVVILVRYIHNPQSTGEMNVVDLYNSGQAFIFRDGLVYDARWTRTAFDSLLALTDAGGSPLPLKPGRVFFEVIGIDSTWSVSGSDWFFESVMP